LDTLDSVAEEMGRLLGWGASEKQHQIDSYRARAAMRQQFRAELKL